MKLFTHTLDQDVLDEATYEEVISKLSDKNGTNKRGLKKAPLIKDLSLEWILDNKQNL